MVQRRGRDELRASSRAGAPTTPTESGWRVLGWTAGGALAGTAVGWLLCALYGVSLHFTSGTPLAAVAGALTGLYWSSASGREGRRACVAAAGFAVAVWCAYGWGASWHAAARTLLYAALVPAGAALGWHLARAWRRRPGVGFAAGALATLAGLVAADVAASTAPYLIVAVLDQQGRPVDELWRGTLLAIFLATQTAALGATFGVLCAVPFTLPRGSVRREVAALPAPAESPEKSVRKGGSEVSDPAFATCLRRARALRQQLLDEARWHPDREVAVRSVNLGCAAADEIESAARHWEAVMARVRGGESSEALEMRARYLEHRASRADDVAVRVALAEAAKAVRERRASVEELHRERARALARAEVKLAALERLLAAMLRARAVARGASGESLEVEVAALADELEALCSL